MISEQHLAFITKSMTKISASYYNRQNDLYNFVKRNVQEPKYLLALQLCEYCVQSTFGESLGDRMPFSTADANATPPHTHFPIGPSSALPLNAIQ